MTKNEFERVKELLERAAYEGYLLGLEEAQDWTPFSGDPKDFEHFKIQGGTELLLRRELNRR